MTRALSPTLTDAELAKVVANRDRHAPWQRQRVKLVSDLRNLIAATEAAITAVEARRYYDGAPEARLLNAIYDVTEIDAVYDRAREIDPAVGWVK